MACILRASGIRFDVDQFLDLSAFTPCAVYRLGEPRWRSKPTGPKNERSGFNLVASDADFDEIAAQIQDAIAFLTRNMQELQALQTYSGVDDLTLDFGIRQSDDLIQTIVFPAALLRLAGALDITLEISLYPVGDDDEAEE